MCARRSEANYRLYPEDTLERLKLIECWKRQKLTLEEIKERIGQWQVGASNPKAAEVVQHVQELQDDMRKLEEQVQELTLRLKTMDEKQAKLIARQLSLQGSSLLHTLMLLLGDTPF